MGNPKEDKKFLSRIYHDIVRVEHEQLMKIALDEWNKTRTITNYKALFKAWMPSRLGVIGLCEVKNEYK